MKSNKLYLKNLKTLLRVDDIIEVKTVFEDNIENMFNHINNQMKEFIETKTSKPLKPFAVTISDEQFLVIEKKIKQKISQPIKPNFDFLLLGSNVKMNSKDVIMIIIKESYRDRAIESEKKKTQKEDVELT